MEKKYNPSEYNNAVPCEVCGQITFIDDYGNSEKCPHCGWMQCADNERTDKTLGISYPMLVPLSRAREQYKAGQKFKATFEDFINGLMFYSEMLFWHHGLVHEVYTKLKSNDLEAYVSGDCIVVFCNKEMKQEYNHVNEFREKANINGRLLKDIWDEVVHPCFMYCAEKESDYDFPPED